VHLDARRRVATPSQRVNLAAYLQEMESAPSHPEEPHADPRPQQRQRDGRQDVAREEVLVAPVPLLGSLELAGGSVIAEAKVASGVTVVPV
jgi:hypothetical protein